MAGRKKPTIYITGSQHERPADVLPVALPPASPADWDALRTKTRAELEALGCAPWETQADGSCLMLFPATWYDSIPAGFEITSISGRKEQFAPGKTDDDRRYGALAYGVVAKV